MKKHRKRGEKKANIYNIIWGISETKYGEKTISSFFPHIKEAWSLDKQEWTWREKKND